MNFDYTVTTEKPFDRAVEDIQAETAKAGMRVLHVHDVQQTLAEKGFARGPLKIIEICNAKFAYEVLSVDINIGLLMPCKINVYTQDGQTIISGMRPSILSQFFPQAELGEIPQKIEGIVVGIIDSSR